MAREKTRRGDVARGGSEEETADIALTEAKARVVMRVVTRSLLWVIVVGLVLSYLFQGVVWVFYALTGVLLLVVLSVFFAYLIAPLVELVRRPFNVKGRARVVPRPVAIGIVYVLIFGSVGLGVYLLTPVFSKELSRFAEQAPVYMNNARVRAARLNQVYDKLNLPPSIREAANSTVTRLLEGVGEYTTGQGFQGFITLLGYIPWLVLVPILAFFLLKDADSFRRSALQMLPRGRLRWRGDEFFQDINSTLAAYIRAQLIACLLIGTICTAGFMLIGVPYALVLGVVAGLLEFIPLVGPLMVAIIAVTVASFYSGGQVIAVLLFLGVLRIVHDYVTYPRIIGSGIHLHPLAVILAILAGHELAGVAGIFLAIPVIAVLTVTYRHWLEHRGSEGLVADLLKPAAAAAVATADEADQITNTTTPPTTTTTIPAHAVRQTPAVTPADAPTPSPTDA